MDATAAHREMDARELTSGATLLAALLFLWGAISLALLPLHPFGVPNALQVVVGGAALVGFWVTRAQPSASVARVFSTLVIAYTLVLLPWTAIAWSRLGRPMEALTVPQIASVAMALVLPRSLALRTVLIVLFLGEALFAWAYAEAAGQAALMPLAAVPISFYFGFLGIALGFARERRRQLARRHLRVQAELEALRRVTPLFAEVRHGLARSLASLTSLIAPLGADENDGRAGRLVRAVDRLGVVRDQLDELIEAPLAVEQRGDGEERLRDHDAHFGATVFAALVASIAVQPALFRWPLPTLAFAALGGASTLVCAALVVTRRHPSERWAIAVVITLWATSLVVASFAQLRLVASGRPFIPFLGHKLLILIIGIVAVSRLRLGIALVAATALAGFAFFWVAHMPAHRELIAAVEPWVLIAFVVIGVASLVMRDQRRVASLRLRQAELEAQALHRRALMYLALRDRLSSPLQTLVLGAALIQPADDASGGQLRADIESLVAISGQLAELDRIVPAEARAAAMDADGELRPRLG